MDLATYYEWILMMIDLCGVFLKSLKLTECWKGLCGSILQDFLLEKFFFWKEKTICKIIEIETLKMFMPHSTTSNRMVYEWVI